MSRMDRSIDRRALFATGSAAALLAAVGVSAEAAPVRGGFLRAALSGGDRAEGWQSQPGGAFLRATRHAVFETLTEIAPDGTLQPGLATDWTSFDDGAVWQFNLRDDVLFHDGVLLMPTDVVASFVAQGLNATAAVNSVTVRLVKADPAFPLRAAQDDLVVFKAEELATDGRLNTGTGLYQIVRFDAGRTFIGARVETHRKDGRAGWFEKVELVAVSDDAVRAEAVRDGIVDVADLSGDFGLGQDKRLSLINDRGDVCAVTRDCIRRPARMGRHLLDDMRFVERWWVAS